MIYCKYYKFTTTTNDSGDYMIFGLPIGAHNLHVEADLSDIGFLSQKPYNLMSEGSNKKLFKSPSQFKNINDTVNPIQLKKVSPVSVNVIPFWGDEEQFEIGITRLDVDLLVNIKPTAIFMGSVITDNEKNSLNKNCRPRRGLGKMDELTTGPGTIEMIRKTSSGTIERYDVEGGRVIDENGVWCYQIPMNLEYKVTSESGQLVSSNDPKIGIATSAEVRFRVGMDISGSEGRQRRRAKFLIPNNPESHAESDYTFDSTTKPNSFKKLYWNKLYSVKNHITRVQPNRSIETRNFIGIKATDDPKNNNPFPYNKIDTKGNPLFFIILSVLSTIAFILWFLNRSIIYILNIIILPIQKVIWGIQKLTCTLRWPLPTQKKKRAACRCYKLYKKTEDGDPQWQFDPEEPNCAKAYYDVNADDISDKEDSEFCNDSTNKCSDSCAKGYCTNYSPGAAIPYFKLDCGPDRYMLWSINDDKTVCDDLSNEGGQKTHCKNKGVTELRMGAYLRCQANQLALALNMVKFDFYNDWVNGSLYLFLLKYKVFSTKKEKFCDIECDSENGDYDDSDTVADNNCRSNYILDNCTIAEPQKSINKISTNATSLFDAGMYEKIREGYIKRGSDGELYYAAISRKTKYKLFATDIIDLGSINKFDWQGTPQMYRFLVDTTFQLPPLSDEKNEEDASIIDTSGINGDKNLFFSFGYSAPITIYINGSGANCNNIKRVCELGVGLDENREDENKGPVDGKIGNNDVENPFVRGVFSYLNTDTNYGNIPLVYIDNGSEDSATNFAKYQNIYYKQFRVFPNHSDDIWQYENSYYFYFGLRPNNTALTKLNNEYLTPCIKEVNSDFQCQLISSVRDDEGDNPTGELEVSILGGVLPLTYEWNGPTVGGQQYPLSQNIVTDNTTTKITGLYSGTYNLKTTDSVNNIIECSFQVSGPIGVQCDAITDNVTKNGEDDGKIEVNVNGGIAPYIYVLYDDNTNVIIDNQTTNQTNITYTDLSANDYGITITDSSSTPTRCEQVVTISEPDGPNINVTSTDPSCWGGKGSATIFPQDGSGTGDSTIEWKNSDGDIISTGNVQIFGLSPGDYEVTYTDSLDQSVSKGFTISQPERLRVDSYDVVSGSTGFEVSVEFEADANSSPYTLKLYDYDSINTTGNGPIETQVITSLTYTFQNKINKNKEGGIGVIEISDNKGCNAEKTINIQ
jgi:hypothetical protein